MNQHQRTEKLIGKENREKLKAAEWRYLEQAESEGLRLRLLQEQA